MSASAQKRPPFDAEDARQAEAYLAATGRVSFDPFAAEDGKRELILTTSLADARLMMAESFATRDAQGRAFRVFPFFVERPTLDAFAVDHRGLHLCGVNIGLVSAVYELALFVFSQATLFRDVGNAAGERSPMLPANAALTFWIADRVAAGEGANGRPVGAELVPQDGQRQMGALFLALLMLRFVWLHELFHCLNGHAGLRAQQGRETALHEVTDGAMLSLVEVERAGGAAASVSDGHCMEFDADRSAFWMMMKRQAAGEELIDGIRALPEHLRLRLTAFAAVLMTFLFDQAAKRRKAATGGSHPVAYHRLHNLVRTWASHLLDPAGQMKQVFAYTIVEMDGFNGCVLQAVSGTRLVEDLRSVEMEREFEIVDGLVTASQVLFGLWTFRQLTKVLH